MNMPCVSIIVPNYNHALFLPERLDSIFNQTFQDFEVILLDDASSDDSIQVLNAYTDKYKGKISYFVVNEKNTGSPFKQWKKGIELAKGEYIWIAESDDCCHPNFLETCINRLEEYPHVSATVTNSSIMNNGDLLYMPRPFNNREEDSIIELKANYCIEKCPIRNVSSVVFRKAIVDNNLYSTYVYIGDKSFYFEFLADKQVFYCKESLNYYRIHHNNVSKGGDLKSEINKYFEHYSFLKRAYQKDKTLKPEIVLAAKQFRHKITNRINKKTLLFNKDAIVLWIRFKFLTFLNG